jgi:predicted GTPase
MKLGNVLGLALTDLTPKQRAGIMSVVLRKGA